MSEYLCPSSITWQREKKSTGEGKKVQDHFYVPDFNNSLAFKNNNLSVLSVTAVHIHNSVHPLVVFFPVATSSVVDHYIVVETKDTVVAPPVGYRPAVQQVRSECRVSQCEPSLLVEQLLVQFDVGGSDKRLLALHAHLQHHPVKQGDVSPLQLSMSQTCQIGILENFHHIFYPTFFCHPTTSCFDM